MTQRAISNVENLGIYHFTFLCSVTWPFISNGSEGRGDLALIQTSQLFSWKCTYLALEQLDLHKLSHTGQNYWMLIGWDRGHFFLMTRALLVIKRAWLLDADWLSTPALSWFPASNGFWKISETHRFWSKHGYFILMWKRIDMQRNAVFWWKSKRIFPTKTVLIRSLKNIWVGRAGVAWGRIELQNFMAAKVKVSFFVLLRLISITAHLMGVKNA